MSSADEYTGKSDQIKALLTTSVAEVNQWVGFSQRKRQCDAVAFVQTVVLGWLGNPKASLNELAATASQLGHTITRQGLDERMTNRAVALLVGVLQVVLEHQIDRVRLSIPGLAGFRHVWITDSTQLVLPDKLATDFSGNLAGKSMAKLHVSLDYLSGQIQLAPVEAGTIPDQRYCLPAELTSANSLHLFDLGYFSQGRLVQIANQEAYFVTRYQSQTALYEAGTGERVELLDLLPTNGSQFEWYGMLGAKARLPVRLVAQRVSAEVAAQRRRQVQAKAKKNGKQCSERYLRLQDWEILITNLNPAQLLSHHLFDLYAVRWQIELVFRAWKSQLALAHLGKWRPERVLSQLYAHLIGCVLCHDWTQAWRWRRGIEYSLPKLLHIIRQHLPQLLRVLRADGRGFRSFWRSLERDFRQFGRKDKRRKSLSTLQTLINWDLT